jgi:hypothetical protein
MWQSPGEIFLSASIWAITGNYGSGKTELAINLALDSAKDEPVTLVDLDIVNPYFRSAEREGLLTKAGVRVLKPTFALSTVDIPALPAEITSIFERGERAWLDVGGDDTGAAAMGVYQHPMKRAQGKMVFVINARRPLTGDADSILDLMRRIESRARLPIFALCNNTNLGAETTAEDILFGRDIVADVARRSGIPRAFHGVATHLLDDLPEDVRRAALPITPYMRPEWL